MRFNIKTQRPLFLCGKVRVNSEAYRLGSSHPRFEKLSKEARTTERMFEEDQLLYEFFSHAYSLVDSFCFGAYFVGAQLSPSHFKPNPNLRSVNPRKTRDYFEKFDASSA